MLENPEKFQCVRAWFIKYRLRNGMEGCYLISESDKDRLWDMLQKIGEEKGIEFFEFNSDTHHILIQLSQVIFYQFLFEYVWFDPAQISEAQNSETQDAETEDFEEDGDPYSVKIYFTNNPIPVTFNVDNDPNPKEEGDAGEMGNFIFFALNADEEDLLHFTDTGGETAFFRASTIALVETPLRLLEANRGLDEEDKELEDA